MEDDSGFLALAGQCHFLRWGCPGGECRMGGREESYQCGCVKSETSLRQPSGDSEEAARGPAKAQAKVTHAGVTYRHVFPALYFHHGHNFHMTCHSDRLTLRARRGSLGPGMQGKKGPVLRLEPGPI